MHSNSIASSNAGTKLNIDHDTSTHHLKKDNEQRATFQNFGIGARFTVNVMCDSYIDILLNALSNTDASKVAIHTDAVSTYVSGEENDMLNYIASVIAKVATHGHHISAMILFSRGCPGEVTCQIPNHQFFPTQQSIKLKSTGIKVLAQWSLYPLFDEQHTTFSHMDDIYRAIEFAKEKGTYKRTCHFVTELEGDLADVLETIATGWMLVGKTVQHVTTHAILSINSPTQVIEVL